MAEQAAHSQALMGVPFPVVITDVRKAMDRLLGSIVNPREEPNVLVKLAKIYVVGFVRDPKLAINLHNPLSWPERVRGLRRFLQIDNNRSFTTAAPSAKSRPSPVRRGLFVKFVQTSASC